MTVYVTCPTCGKKIEWGEKERWRPFCSERCRLIDLGKWAGEEHRISGEEQPPEESENGEERHR